MHVQLKALNQASVFCYTGGKTFNPNQPTLLMVHGVLNDHSVWHQQSRHMANQGWNVLAIDLPGQGKSTGSPPASVEEAAAALLELLDTLGVQQAALVGHSFGSLICLELAGQHPGRVSHLVLVGTAYPMKVSPALLEMSVSAPEKAIAMVNQFSHSMLALPASAQSGGFWTYGASRALMRKTLASNPKVNVFYTGFNACNTYAGGEAAIQKVTCPILFLLGKDDQMTPPKAASALADQARNSPSVKTMLLNAGHALMAEAPEEVLAAIKQFVKA
jgi:pimeloyl-ACP methyl ester carboxylesterase